MTTDPNRQPAGIPTGGQFAATTHAEPGITVGSSIPVQLHLSDDPFLGRDARCPEPRPAEWVFGRDECVDAAVGTVMDGPLSRGVVNAQRRLALHDWHDWAAARARQSYDQDYEDFAMGLRTGAASLYERRMNHYEPGLDRFKHGGTPVYVLDHAVQVAKEKRTSAEDREHWRKLLQHAPSDAWHRGHLAAGLILSGADSYWGLRGDPEAAVHGPEEDEPDVEDGTDSNQVFDFEVMGGDGPVTFSVDDLGGGSYSLYAEDGSSIEFEHHGDPEDHYGIQDKAVAALKARGTIDDDATVF